MSDARAEPPQRRLSTILASQRNLLLYIILLLFADESHSEQITALGVDVQSLRKISRRQGSIPPYSSMDHARTSRVLMPLGRYLEQEAAGPEDVE